MELGSALNDCLWHLVSVHSIGANGWFNEGIDTMAGWRCTSVRGGIDFCSRCFDTKDMKEERECMISCLEISWWR